MHHDYNCMAVAGKRRQERAVLTLLSYGLPPPPGWSPWTDQLRPPDEDTEEPAPHPDDQARERILGATPRHARALAWAAKLVAEVTPDRVSLARVEKVAVLLQRGVPLEELRERLLRPAAPHTHG